MAVLQIVLLLQCIVWVNSANLEGDHKIRASGGSACTGDYNKGHVCEFFLLEYPGTIIEGLGDGVKFVKEQSEATTLNFRKVGENKYKIKSSAGYYWQSDDDLDLDGRDPLEVKKSDTGDVWEFKESSTPGLYQIFADKGCDLVPRTFPCGRKLIWLRGWLNTPWLYLVKPDKDNGHDLFKVE